MKLAAWIALLLIGCCFTAGAAEPETLQTKVVLSGLNRPSSVALESVSSDLFLIEHGAGRVLRLPTKQLEQNAGEAKAQPVIVGLPTGDDALQLRGSGIVFLNRNTLTLLRTFRDPAGDRIVSFALPSVSDTPISYDAAIATVTSPTGREAFAMGGLAMSASSLFVLAKTTTDEAVLLKSGIKDGAAGQLRVFATAEQASIARPTAMTLSSRGELVLLSQSPSTPSGSEPAATGSNSLLTFTSAVSNRMLMSLPVPLENAIDVAYAPRSGNLYVLDAGNPDGQNAGLYRIDATLVDGKPAATAVKLLPLERPMSMTFSRQDQLFISIGGTEPTAGQLISVSGKL